MIKDIFLVLRAWYSAHLALNARLSVSEIIRIIRAYGSKGRAYHVLHHIADCIRFVDENYFLGEGDRAIIILALIYHDVVYDVSSKTNEEDSRDQFFSYGFDRFSDMVVPEVCRLIMLTKGHALEDACCDRRGAVMIDADMHVFLLPQKLYAGYARGIAREYASPRYVEGRTAFLNSLVPYKIFHTEEVIFYLPNVARNIAWELDTLAHRPEELVEAW